MVVVGSELCLMAGRGKLHCSKLVPCHTTGGGTLLLWKGHTALPAWVLGFTLAPSPNFLLNIHQTDEFPVGETPAFGSLPSHPLLSLSVNPSILVGTGFPFNIPKILVSLN